MNSLKIAILQHNIIWHNAIANQQQLEKQFKQLPQAINLVVLPEMWTTGFTMKPEEVAETMDGSTIKWMKQMAKTHHTAICGSLAIQEGNNFFNRFIFVHPTSRVEFYDKAHPYTPLGESKVYRAGKGSALIEYAGFRIRPLVCYDLRFPVLRAIQITMTYCFALPTGQQHVFKHGMRFCEHVPLKIWPIALV